MRMQNQIRDPAKRFGYNQLTFSRMLSFDEFGPQSGPKPSLTISSAIPDLLLVLSMLHFDLQDDYIVVSKMIFFEVKRTHDSTCIKVFDVFTSCNKASTVRHSPARVSISSRTNPPVYASKLAVLVCASSAPAANIASRYALRPGLSPVADEITFTPYAPSDNSPASSIVFAEIVPAEPQNRPLNQVGLLQKELSELCVASSNVNICYSGVNE